MWFPAQGMLVTPPFIPPQRPRATFAILLSSKCCCANEGIPKLWDQTVCTALYSKEKQAYRGWFFLAHVQFRRWFPFHSTGMVSNVVSCRVVSFLRFRFLCRFSFVQEPPRNFSHATDFGPFARSYEWDRSYIFPIHYWNIVKMDNVENWMIPTGDKPIGRMNQKIII